MSDRTPITQFRRWLKETPQPASVRCDDNDRKVLKVPKTRSCWSDVEKSVLALDAAMVEALDGSGNVLRVFRLKEGDAEPVQPSQKEQWPAGEQAELAQVLSAACDRAASRHEAAYRMAFDRLSDMYEAQSQRLEEVTARAARLEADNLRMRERLLTQATAPAAPSADDDLSINDLITALIQAKLGQEVGAVVNGANGVRANGKDS